MTEPPPVVPGEPATKSEKWRDILRGCANALVTFATLVPLIYVAINKDIDGLVLELFVQAVLVAGIIHKIMQIPMVDSWLASLGIGRQQAGMKPVEPRPDPNVNS